MKKPACASKRDMLELYLYGKIIPFSIVLIGIASITDNPDWWPVTGSASNLDPAQPILDYEMAQSLIYRKVESSSWRDTI